jgi:hypothetical protein
MFLSAFVLIPRAFDCSIKVLASTAEFRQPDNPTEFYKFGKGAANPKYKLAIIPTNASPPRSFILLNCPAFNDL